ncbi:MAG: phosphatidate cytidylyltransferase [Pseudohongiellaceae bacterium]|jgi:phosphatidate cytidylyltransferase
MLLQRIVTAIVLLVVLVLACVYLTPFSFSLFVGVVVLLAAWEWVAFIGLASFASKLGYLASLAILLLTTSVFLGVQPDTSSLYVDRVVVVSILGLLFWVCAAFLVIDYPARKSLWNKESKIAAMGIFALLPTWVGVVQLKYFEPSGVLVLGLVILVAAVDIGAYFSGKALGKTKLSVELSPNKTWEGVWGGVGLSLLIMLAFTWILKTYYYDLGVIQFVILAVTSLVLAFFSVIGDLLESMLKRNQKLKDSGKILPGHGGILDRVDGLIAATPIFVLAITAVLLGVI